MTCFSYRPPQFAVSAGVALAFWLVLTGIATAHAALNATDPIDNAVVEAAPARYSLTFSEPVSPLALTIVRPDASVVPLERFAVKGNAVEIEGPQDLSQGTHILTWRVVSTDGHPVGGSLVFSIGAPSATPPSVPEATEPGVRAGLWITKVVLYTGLAFGIGGAFALNWLVRPSRGGTAVAGVALVAGIAATALSPGFQGADALGGGLSSYFDQAVWVAGMQTSYGATVVAMLVALFLAVFSLLVEQTAWARALSLTALLAGAGALALSGHASAAEPQWLMRPAVFLHALALSVWIGALAPLAVALRADDDSAVVGLRRFSALIPIAILALAVAGGALAAVQLGDPAALAQTAYGRLLAVKLVLLVLLFGLAAFNRWRLTAGALAGASKARTHLVRSILAETFVVLVILGVVAGWRFTPPPRALAAAAAQPASAHIHTVQAMADLTVSPGRAGEVDVSAVLMTGDFGPLDTREVAFVFSNAALGIEPFRREASKPGDGTWRAEDVVLPLPGRWTVEIEILITDFDLARIRGEIVIRP